MSNPWEQRWQEGTTGWDRGASAPVLHRLLEEATDLPPGRVLVPGCGAGYDVITWARAGWQAVGLDVAPTARERFSAVRERAGLQPDQAEVVVGDFFRFVPQASFELVWDYTFLCAIEPEARPAWARQMATLIRPEGELLTLLYPLGEPEAARTPVEGPPYLLHPAVVEELLAPGFFPVATIDVHESHEGREGREVLLRWHRRRSEA